LVIVDNQSSPASVVMLERIARDEGANLILNAGNRGIATALNQGVGEALRRGYAWALLFDQDSDPARNLGKSLERVYGQHPARNRLAVIGVNYTDHAGKNVRYGVPSVSNPGEREGWYSERTVITSGSLVSVEVFHRLEGFRDEFFIDHVDDEYCLRARADGWKVIATQEPLMRHSIGEVTAHRILAWRTGTSNHAAVRRYYSTRNCVVLAKEYLRSDPRWVCGALAAWIKGVILMLVFEDHRGQKLAHVGRGLRDGWRGVLGPLGRRGPR
jgi:rhamnosyltransferase